MRKSVIFISLKFHLSQPHKWDMTRDKDVKRDTRVIELEEVKCTGSITLGNNTILNNLHFLTHRFYLNSSPSLMHTLNADTRQSWEQFTLHALVPA